MSLRLNVRLCFSFKSSTPRWEFDSFENQTWDQIHKALVKNKTYEKGEEAWNSFKKDPKLDSYITVLEKDEVKSLKKNEQLITFISDIHNDWHRTSDNIDSYLIPESQYGKIKYINTNLYPFAENKICLNNFKEIDEFLSRNLWLKEWKSLDKDDTKELVNLGFNKKQPIKNQFYMKAPSVIRNLARGIGLSEEEVLQIRPCLITYLR